MFTNFGSGSRSQKIHVSKSLNHNLHITQFCVVQENFCAVKMAAHHDLREFHDFTIYIHILYYYKHCLKPVCFSPSVSFRQSKPRIHNISVPHDPSPNGTRAAGLCPIRLRKGLHRKGDGRYEENEGKSHTHRP